MTVFMTPDQRIERQRLCESVANTISTYRQGEIEQRTAAHVDRWVSQFTPENQLDFLREFDYVIKQTFITKDVLTEWFKRAIHHPSILNGKTAQVYWRSAHFLNLQKQGESQKELVDLFLKTAEHEVGETVLSGGNSEGDFFYLDDGIFSARKAIQDLSNWIKYEAPKKCRLYVLTAVKHTFGLYLLETEIKKTIVECGKTIGYTLAGAKGFNFENQKCYSHRSQVLWPSRLPDSEDFQDYKRTRQLNNFFARRAGNQVLPFSSEAGRCLLEQEFLIAGAKIVNACVSPKKSMKPLGFGPFEVGFGSLVATYRNCPNNCPLAMWWGNADSCNKAMSWIPLLPRKTYAESGLNLWQFKL